MTSATIPRTHEDILDKKGFGHLATLGPHGEPMSHPVWYDYRQGEILVSTTKDRQKYRNVTRDGRVSMSVTDPDNPYRYLEVRGTVARIEDDPHSDFINFLARKYMNEDKYPYAKDTDERVTFHIRPEHATTQG